MPGGRPPTINQVHRVTEEGERVTVSEACVANLAAGMYAETAAAAVGIDKDSLYRWLKRGARARRAAIRAGKAVPRTEKPYVEFSDSVERAQAEAEARDVALLASLARGGRTVVHQTVKVNAKGETVETTTRTETLAPDARVLMWRLERKFPKRWGHLGSLEVTGANGAPLIPEDDRARDLAEALADFQAGADAERERAEAEPSEISAPDGGLDRL